MIDQCTRECPAIEVGRTFAFRDVKRTLQHLFAIRGAPEHSRSDNGPELIAAAARRWLNRASAGTLYIPKGRPCENRYMASPNGRLRDELLTREQFLSLPEARYVLDERRQECSHRRPQPTPPK